MGKYYSPYNKRKTIYCEDTGEKVSGDRYLSSKHWKEMRKKVYEYYNGVCQRCSSNVPLEVAHIHHRVYKRMGNEKITDLVLYCNHCHAAIHKNKKQNHTNNRSIHSLINSLTNAERAEAYDVLVEHFKFDPEKRTTEQKILDLTDQMHKIKKQIRKLKKEQAENENESI